MYTDLTIIPTFWQRIKFLFCKRMHISGFANTVKHGMRVDFKFRKNK